MCALGVYLGCGVRNFLSPLSASFLCWCAMHMCFRVYTLTCTLCVIGLHLLEESQVPLSSVATVPPTAESRDVTSAVSLVEREGGDVPDEIIDSMVAAVASSGDEEGEEGEVVEEERENRNIYPDLYLSLHQK